MAAEAGPISKVLIVVGNPIPCPLPPSEGFALLCFSLRLIGFHPHTVGDNSPPPIRLLGLAPPAMAAEAGPISKVLIVVAMQTEAMPLVSKFKLVEAPAHESTFPKGAPWVRYHGNYKDLHIDLVLPGKDAVFGVDSVGTVSAALVTSFSIQTLKPDLIINAGTAGGFKAKGASIGDVFLASDVAFQKLMMKVIGLPKPVICVN